MLQRMMGHLPMLFHPNPQQVLNIGLGAGVTFGAVSCYPAEHLEVVEFEPSVVNVAKIWGSKIITYLIILMLPLPLMMAEIIYLLRVSLMM